MEKNPEQDPDEIELIRRIKENDPQALDTLCRRHNIIKVVRDVVFGMLDWKNQGLADDLTSMALMRIVEKIKTFNGKSSFKAWACIVTKNVVNEYWRNENRKKTIKTVSIEIVEEQEDRNAGREDRESDGQLDYKQRLEKYMKILSPEQRDAICLSLSKELALKDVAESMGKTVASIKNLRLRAMKKLKELSDQDEKKGGENV